MDLTTMEHTNNQSHSLQKRNGGIFMTKKLTRVDEGKKICGVCTGIGRYLEVDPTVIRLVFAILACFGGSGILAYLVAAIIMPQDQSIIDAQ